VDDESVVRSELSTFVAVVPDTCLLSSSIATALNDGNDLRCAEFGVWSGRLNATVVDGEQVRLFSSSTEASGGLPGGE
jgi:hypothetical protein